MPEDVLPEPIAPVIMMFVYRAVSEKDMSPMTTSRAGALAFLVPNSKYNPKKAASSKH